MNEIFKTIKKHFILLLGTGLFTYGLFNFNSTVNSLKGYSGCTPEGYMNLRGLEICPTPFTYPVSNTVEYYYSSVSVKLLTIGAIFIVIGLLKMRKENRKLNQK